MHDSSPYMPPTDVPSGVQRPTRVEVDLGSIAHNIHQIKKRVGPHRHLMAMVKADAYGHGAVSVARTALAHGATWLGVALPEEGWALRKAGIQTPILVLGPTFPAQVRVVVEANLGLAVFTWEVAQALDKEAARQGRKATIHLKVDTGMGRMGVPFQRALDLLKVLRGLENLIIEGIYTHFATADHTDKSFTYRQMDTFLEICREAESMGISIPLRHLSNSAAVLDLPETFQDLVRPGIMIYGCYPSKEVQRTLPLRPAMTWKTQVALVKDLRPGDSVSYGRTFVAKKPVRVATLPVGYGDGFSRHLSNHQGEVLIHGQRVPVIGVVCMDMTMVDVTDIAEVRPGDEVVIFGKQQGNSITVEEVAQRMETISYEVLCGVGTRVPRFYLEVPAGFPGEGS